MLVAGEVALELLVQYRKLDLERLSPGQAEELDRVCKAYPHLTDDSFVAGKLEAWRK